MGKGTTATVVRGEGHDDEGLQLATDPTAPSVRRGVVESRSVKRDDWQPSGQNHASAACRPRRRGRRSDVGDGKGRREPGPSVAHPDRRREPSLLQRSMSVNHRVPRSLLRTMHSRLARDLPRNCLNSLHCMRDARRAQAGPPAGAPPPRRPSLPARHVMALSGHHMRLR